MSPQRHKHTGVAVALGVAAVLAATAPAQSMPIDLRTPDARDAAGGQQAFGGSYRQVDPKTGMDHGATEAALAQERYYESHRPTVPASGHDFRTIDARDAAEAPGGAVTRVSAPAAEPAGPSSFEWGDAAIGSGATLGLVLLLAGGAAAVTRRHRPATS